MGDARCGRIDWSSRLAQQERVSDYSANPRIRRTAVTKRDVKRVTSRRGQLI